MDKHLVWLNKKCLCSSTRKLAFYFPSFWMSKLLMKCSEESFFYLMFLKISPNLWTLENIPIWKSCTHDHCTGFQNRRSWNSRRWSLPTAAYRPPGWRMNPPGRWYLVLVIHKKSREDEKRREREVFKLIRFKAITWIYSSQAPKHSKTPPPRISVLYHARKKSLCIYKRRQTHT